MADINRFLRGTGDFSKNSRQVRFQHAVAGTDANEEQRRLEMLMLEPDHLQPYTGPEPTISALTEKTVKLVFETDEQVQQFHRHFIVGLYREPSCWRTGKITALLIALDEGWLTYDETTGRLAATGTGDSGGRAEVGTGEQGHTRRSRVLIPKG